MSESETKSSVWEFFERCSDDMRKAKCLFCHKVYNCSTSHNLKNHLKCAHSDEIDVNNHLINRIRGKNKKDPEDSDSGGMSTRALIRKAYSEVEGDKLAMCNLCKKILSYKSTIGNLRHHLQRVHRDAYPKLLELKTEGNDTDDKYTEDKDNEDKDDEPAYFEVVEEEETSFFKQKSHGKNLKNIKRNLDDTDDDNEVYTEVIYLEEEEKRKPKYKSKFLRSPSKKPLKKRFIKRKAPSTTSSDEDLKSYSLKKRIKNTELDKFGQYIASLLSNMPKHVCTKLQMNIVNQIMGEKLKIESENEKTKTVSVLENVDERKQEIQDIANNDNMDDVQDPEPEHPKYIITDDSNILKNNSN